MSLQETTKENYCTPTIGTHAKCEGDTLNDTVDVSSGDEDLDDRGNAIEFHNLMKLKGHLFKTCGGELLWYDPDEGVYQEENKPMLLKLDNLLGNCTALGTRYRGNSGKKSALRKELKNLVPQENDFYKKSQENTKGFFAFKNCIWDFKEHKDLPFSPNFYFTFKASVEYNKHDAPFEDEVRKNVFESIFGAGEKCEFFISLLARALAGNIEDKRFIVLLGETNSGKGTLTQLLGDCFGLGTFVGNYNAKNLQVESATLSWLLQNKNSRIILANEINAEKTILLNNIKVCANGGEPITATAKYENERNFIPQGTMFLFANEMPEMKGNDDGGAVKNRMVYIETEFSYLEKQKYEDFKDTNPKVRLADPTLKTEYLKRKNVQEAFARVVCEAYVAKSPPLPESCIKKSLEYEQPKSLKKRIDEVVHITGKCEDFVVSGELISLLRVSGKELGTYLKKCDGVEIKKKRFGTVSKTIYSGMKWRDENTTQEYGEGNSTEVSFADVDTAMNSPIKGQDELLDLKAENADLKEIIAQQGVRLAEREQEVCRLEQERNVAVMGKDKTDRELYLAVEKNKDYVALLRVVELETKSSLLGDDDKVLPKTSKKMKDGALVDIFDEK